MNPELPIETGQQTLYLILPLPGSGRKVIKRKHDRIRRIIDNTNSNSIFFSNLDCSKLI